MGRRTKRRRAASVPAVVGKLYDSFAGKLHLSARIRTRSGRCNGQDNPSIVHYRATHYAHDFAAPDVRGERTPGRTDPPPESSRQLKPESATMREA